MKQFTNAKSNTLLDLQIVCSGYCKYTSEDPVVLEDCCSHCEVFQLLKQYSVRCDMLKKQLDTAENCIIEIKDALYRGIHNERINQVLAEYEKKKEKFSI